MVTLPTFYGSCSFRCISSGIVLHRSEVFTQFISNLQTHYCSFHLLHPAVWDFIFVVYSMRLRLRPTVVAPLHGSPQGFSLGCGWASWGFCLGSEHGGSATEGQAVESRYGPGGGQGVGRKMDIRICTWWTSPCLCLEWMLFFLFLNPSWQAGQWLVLSIPLLPVACWLVSYDKWNQLFSRQYFSSLRMFAF